MKIGSQLHGKNEEFDTQIVSSSQGSLPSASQVNTQSAHTETHSVTSARQTPPEGEFF